jgi:hypothetical protein
MVWVLWFFNRHNREVFLGSFFSAEEAEQHQMEEMKSRAWAPEWRFSISGYDAETLKTLREVEVR